ncbi:hypothetical protein LTR15_008212 [Elasticomyces elasticus]|nr:hypothetical protein LTR15_008212 [Elasticomyces elasticus]
MAELNEDIWHLVFQAAAGHDSEDRDRHQESINTLLACCLVCKTWRRLAQSVLQKFLFVSTKAQLDRRLLNRTEKEVSYIRHAVFRQSGEAYFRCDPEPTLLALPTSELFSLVFCMDGTFAQGRDAVDRAAIGTGHHVPLPYPFTLSRLRELLSLQSLGVRFLQREWNIMADVSEMRDGGLLPNVTHLDIETSERNVKSWDGFLSAPLAKWSGIKSIYIYGSDNKCRAALIHGISRLEHVPLIELGAGDMRLHEFKGLFRLRKGKLRQGTVLRLLTSPPGSSHAHRGYGPWDYQAKEYWDEMGEDATEVALKAGVTLEISSSSRKL